MNLKTIQNLSIDFNQKGYKTINAKQGDKETRYVVVCCTDNGIFVPLNNTVYANARTMTADGRALLNPATIQDDGTILLELDDTLLAAPGRASSQIDIYQNDTEKRLTTMSFFINVEPSVYGDDAIVASNEFNALTELIKKATKDYKYVIEESKKQADNAKKYYEQAKDIAESFAGTLRPKGTIAFADLPSAADAKEGDMYNISDQFTTTASFKEGMGNVIPAGSNVYRTDDGFWDVLAGSPVTGVKGDAESSYRRGNVNITAEDIGLENVNNTSDINKPVSTAQQEALDTKVNKNGDKMTGDLEVTGAVTAEEFVGNATSADKISTKRNINGIEFDGTTNAINYGICETASDIAEKIVDCPNFKLVTGAEITVKFTVTNTAANSTLNVNETGAKPIYYRGNAINKSYLASNRTYLFKYNGNEYEAVGDIARANSAQYAGYVDKGEGNPNKVWGTDADGNPGWQDGAASSDIVTLSKSEYDSLPDEKLTDGKIYFISGVHSGVEGSVTEVEPSDKLRLTVPNNSFGDFWELNVDDGNLIIYKDRPATEKNWFPFRMLHNNLFLPQGHSIFTCKFSEVRAGYFKLCRITLLNGNADQPIMFKIIQRGILPVTLCLLFNNVGSASATSVLSFLKDSSATLKYWVFTNTASIFDIYAEKANSYDQLDVVDLYTGNYMKKLIDIEWIGEDVANVPNGSQAAKTNANI